MPMLKAGMQRKHKPFRAPLAIDPTMVLHLPLDEVVDSVTPDKSLYGNHGTVYGATLVAGKKVNALSFDGVDDYVLCPDVGNFDELTVMAWINGKTLKEFAMIVTKDDTAASDAQFNFGMEVTTGILRFAAAIGGVWADDSFNTSLAEDVWHHVAITYDGAKKRAYVNAVKEASEHDATGSITGTHRVMVGARKYTAPEYFWQGIIDEVRTFNRALSQTEIQQSMGAVTGGLLDKYWMKKK